jgi:preprotein translocase subunit SecF
LDFVAKRGWFFLFSLSVIVPGVVFLVLFRLEPGIDFSGGSEMKLRFLERVEQADLRTELADQGHPDARVQVADDIFLVHTKELTEVEKNRLVETLKNELSPKGVEDLAFDFVSPVVAQETVTAALWAVLAAAVGIFFYVWWAFRNVPSPFRYGTAAIVALIHDTLIVVGIFAILGYAIDLEVNTMFLIALLTVIGYSVNDTIVVFDRLRENVAVYPNRGLPDIVNLSISESLGRSMNTSLTLLFTLLAMMLFGGPTIRSFLLVLLIGVVVGTYSSIGIASQLVVSWEAGDFGRIFRRVSPFGAR